MKKINLLVGVLLVSLLGSACDKAVTRMAEKMGKDERPTRGHIKIGVDETYYPLSEAELYTFESLYENAQIDPVYASEDSILSLFMADSIRLMITSRQLTDNEVEYLKSKLIYPKTTRIAYDALALVVNKSNPLKLINYNIVKDIFSNKVTSWKQVDPSVPYGNIRVVFDNQGSSNVRLIAEKFGLTALPDYVFAAGSHPAVIDYVESHPETIGVIGVNWISDEDDSITHAFLDRVKVLGITSETDPEGDEFYQPHPAYIADKSYPFIREVYAINRETFTGLGTGLISFMAGDSGQRIILKMGMLPATIPIRLVQIRNEY